MYNDSYETVAWKLDANLSNASALSMVPMTDEKQLDLLIISNLTILREKLWMNGYLQSSRSQLKLLAPDLQNAGSQFSNFDILLAEVEGESERFIKFILVEDKLAKNPEQKRKVLAQVIEYSFKLSTISVKELSGSRSLQVHTEWLNANADLISKALMKSEAVVVICGDYIQNQVVELLKYYKEHLNPVSKFDIILMEWPVVSCNEHRIVMPRIVAECYCIERHTISITITDPGSNAGVIVETEKVVEHKKLTGKSNLEWEEFLRDLGSEAMQNLLRQMHQWVEDDSETLMMQGNAESFTLGIQDPNNRNDYRTLFLLQAKTQALEIRNFISSEKMEQSENLVRIAISYAEELSELFTIPINQKIRFHLTKTITFGQLEQKFSEFECIVKKVIKQIKELY